MMLDRDVLADASKDSKVGSNAVSAPSATHLARR